MAAGSMLWDLRPAQDHQAPYKKWAIYTSSRSLIAAITALVAGVLYSLGGGGLEVSPWRHSAAQSSRNRWMSLSHP